MAMLLDAVSARLTSQTRERFHRVTAALEQLDDRAYLCRMYGFHAPAERQLAAAHELDDVVADAKLRINKLALLAFDLLALGVDRRTLAAVPRMAVPELDDLPVALGWMYILETTTLAARRQRGGTDRPRRRKKAVEPAAASGPDAYVHCYGNSAESRWRELVAAIDDYAANAGAADRIVAAASDCLDRLESWLADHDGAT